VNGIQKQKEYFGKLVDVIDTPLYTTRNWRQGNQYKPGKRLEVGKVSPPIDHRSIGSNEVVIELDAPSYKQNYNYAQQIITYLVDAGIPHYAFWSGNKSIHLHIFLELEIKSDEAKALVNEAIEKHCNIYQEIRLKFTSEILLQSGLSLDLIGQGKIVDLAKLKWNDISGATTLIRSCGGANIKLDATGQLKVGWKTYYTELPKNKPRAVTAPLSFDAVEYPEKLERYTLTESFIAEAADSYIRRLDPKKLQDMKPVNYKGGFMNVPCTQQIIEGEVGAGMRNVGAKILAIATKVDGMTSLEADDVMKRYVDVVPQLPEPYDLVEATQWKDWIHSQDKTYWNCKFAIDAGLCKKTGCAYYKEKYKQELALFDHDNPLQIIKTALDVMIVGETLLKMQLFLLYLTKEFEPEWCIMLDGPASSGKTHVMKKVAQLFGDEREAYYSYSRLTQASLNHMEELAKEWKGKIVIIEELQGAKNVVEQIRVAISEGKLTLLETTEVDVGGVKSHVTKAKEIIFENVLFVTCNAEDFDQGEQLKSRAWILNTDQSTEQTLDIIDFYLKGFQNDHKVIPNLPEIRSSISLLEKPDIVIFPFAEELKAFIPSSSVRGRRDVKKMISLIKSSAYFHQKRRKWCQMGTKRVLLADWRDVLITFGFAGDSLNASTQGIGSKDLEYYEMIVANMHYTPMFTVDDVIRWCKVSYAGGRKLMCNLQEAGFFENTTKPPMKASYTKSEISPEYMGDIKELCVEKIENQEEKLEEWVKSRNG